ncbi:hypothetical protein Tco_0919123 [Tanacetum coccineum]
MSTSKTYQQSLADAGSETRPPMLERGSYIPWASRFRRYIDRKRENRKWLNKALDEGPYQFQMFILSDSTVPKLQTAEDLQGDALLHYDAEIEVMNLILLSILNDIYNSVDACTSTKDMWKRIERLMRETIQNQNPPYKFKWTEKTVLVFEVNSETTTEGYMENYKNVSQDIRDQLNAKAEAVQIILTGIDNDIYSTVDACPNACEM